MGKEVTEGETRRDSARFCPGNMEAVGVATGSLLIILLGAVIGLAVLASLVMSIIALAVALKKKS